MSNPFFDHPIVNSPYEYPQRHWELDNDGQPTQRIIDTRRPARFISPVPKPKKRKKAAGQQALVLPDAQDLSTEQQQYGTTAIK